MTTDQLARLWAATRELGRLSVEIDEIDPAQAPIYDVRCLAEYVAQAEEVRQRKDTEGLARHEENYRVRVGRMVA